MNYKELAKAILQEVGGPGNVKSLTNCMTRLRFVLKDDSKVDDSKVAAIPGVVGVNRQGEQFQVIIGNEVANVYKAIESLGDFTAGSSDEATATEKKGRVSAVLDFISACMSPLFPALIGAGLIKVILVLLGPSVFKVLSDESATYTILSSLGDATFYFMPFAVAVTASQRLKVNTFLALGTVGLLIHPGIITLLGGEEATKLFDFIPVAHASYNSSLIPALLTVLLLKYVDIFFDKVLPTWTKNFLKPMLVMLITALVSLVALAPLGNIVGQGIMFVITSVYGVAPWLTGAILGAGMPFIIMTGMHWAFVPITIMALSNPGFDTLFIPAMMVSNIAQGGATLGVGFKTKNKDLKSMAFSAGITATLAGVTEPALYGVTLKLKKPLYALCAVSAVGGLFTGLFGVKAYAFATPSLLAMVQFIDPEGSSNFIIACVIAVFAFVGSLLAAYLITDNGQSDLANPEESMSSSEEELSVYNPLEGNTIPLSDVEDATFASGVLGKGYAVEPLVGLVKAPFSGTVEVLMPSNHALGLVSDSGVTVLVHIGLDTVELDGKYFEPKVKVGDRITLGQELMVFDIAAIEKAGYKVTTPVIVTNSEEFDSVHMEELGQRLIGEKMITVER